MYAQLASDLPLFDPNQLVTTAQALTLLKKVACPDIFLRFQAQALHQLHQFSPLQLCSLLEALAELVVQQQVAPCGRARVIPTATRGHSGHSGRCDVDGDYNPFREVPIPKVESGGDRSLHDGEALRSWGMEEAGRGSGCGGGCGVGGDEPDTGHGTMLDWVQLAAAGSDGSVSNSSAGPGGSVCDDTTHMQQARVRDQKACASNSAPAHAHTHAHTANSITTAAAAAAAPIATTTTTRRAPMGEPGSIRRRQRVVLPGPPAVWLHQVSHRVHELLSELGASALATAMWALSVLGSNVGQRMLDDFICLSHPLLYRMHTHDLVRVAQSLATFRYRPTPASRAASSWGPWFESFHARVGQGQFGLHEVCDLIPALSGLPTLPPGEVVAHVLGCARRGRPAGLRHLSPLRLCLLAAGLRGLRYLPDVRFLHALTQAVRLRWTAFLPRQLASLLASFAVLYAPPPAVHDLWWPELLVAVQCQAHLLDPPSLVAVMQAAATLLAVHRTPWPGTQWVQAVLARAADTCHDLKPAQAAAVLCSLARVVAAWRARGQGRGMGAWEPPKDLVMKLVGQVSLGGGGEGGGSGLSPEVVAEVNRAVQFIGCPPLPPHTQQAARGPVGGWNPVCG